MRLSPSQAGPNWGAHFVPRIGTEVLVGFIDGDIDRPHIVGSLYNGQDPLPWAAGVASGANHPGVIAGHHSVTLEGAGFNQWLTDDAPGQLRTRLATSSATSQLSLGYLIHQAPASAQRGAWRGVLTKASAPPSPPHWQPQDNVRQVADQGGCRRFDASSAFSSRLTPADSTLQRSEISRVVAEIALDPLPYMLASMGGCWPSVRPRF